MALWAHPCPPFLPLLLGPSQTPEPLFREGARGGLQLLLPAPRREVQPLGASGGPPFLQLLPGQGSPQGFLSPHTEPLSCSGTSSLQPVCPVRPQVQSAWEARPFVPTLTPTHTRLRAAGRRVVTKAGSHSIRKVWKPPSFLHPLPPVTWLGAGAGRPQGGPGLGLWVCFDWSVICCPLG